MLNIFWPSLSKPIFPRTNNPWFICEEANTQRHTTLSTLLPLRVNPYLPRTSVSAFVLTIPWGNMVGLQCGFVSLRSRACVFDLGRREHFERVQTKAEVKRCLSRCAGAEGCRDAQLRHGLQKSFRNISSTYERGREVHFKHNNTRQDQMQTQQQSTTVPNAL